MKRLTLNISTILILSLGMASCQKYLNVDAQSDYVYISSVSDCQNLLDDYNGMNTNAPVDQMISSDEYYVTDADLLTLASQPQEVTFYRWDADAIRPVNSGTTDWNAAYRKIFTANLILENVPKLRKEDSSPELDNVEGSALFQRAFNLWGIAQLYAKPYNVATAKDDAGIPIRLTSDINEKISRSSVQVVYDQVISDLQKAAGLMPDTALIATRPSKVAAYSMLARVYLSMSDYKNALSNATSALAIDNRLLDYSQLNTTSSTPFAVFNKEVIFHTTSRSNSSILSPGYATSPFAKITPDLINSYASQDLRKTIFFKLNTSVDTGTYRFSGNYDGTSFTSFFEGIAVDEVYITRAECYARQGNTDAAMADLNTLLKTRFVNTVANPYIPVTAASAPEALSIILKERKKELVMRGLRWTDLRRLNLDPATAITLTRVIGGKTYTLPPNDVRYTLLLPTEVIAGNNIEQNAR